MITHFFRTLKDSELKTVSEPRTGVWTHVVNPTDDELTQLVTWYELDVTVLEDARDFFEVPRLERHGEVSYCFTRYPYEDSDEDIDTAPILIAVGPSFVVTVVVRTVPQFDQFISGKTPIVTTQKTKFFLQLMTTIITSYETELTRLRRAVHRNKIRLQNIGSTEIGRLVNYEHALNDLIAAIIPTNTWLKQVARGNYFSLFPDDAALMEDLMITNEQLIESARSVLKTIQNIRHAAEAILTSNLNHTIRTLTIVTILLTIPTLISSLYGMNVPLPLADEPWVFVGILGVIGTIVSVVILWFRQNRWL